MEVVKEDLPVHMEDEAPRSRTLSNTFSYGKLDANKVLSAFGKFGRYQMMTYLITNSVNLLYAINMMIMPFITEPPEFECEITVPENTHWIYRIEKECKILDGNNWTVSCLNIPGARYEYNDTSSSLAAEFNLVCEDYESVEHASAIFLLGGMLIAPVITQLSDLFGRRITFLIPLYLSVVSNLICAFAPNYTIFLFFRFIAGVATVSFNTIGATLSLESVSTKFRNYLPVLGNMAWVIGYLMAGVLRIFISNWRWLYFAASVPGLLTIPFVWMTPESIHWLISNRKNAAVMKYITTSSRINRTTIPLNECKSESVGRTNSGDDAAPKRRVKKRTVVDIFNTPSLLINLSINAFILVIMNLTYWALSLFSTDMSDDKMTGFFLSGLVELPAAVLAFFMIFYFDRKTVSFVSLLLQGAAMFGALLSPAHSWWLVLFPLVAKCFNAVVWSSQTLLYSEAVPTSVRNVFTGVICFLGDIGSVLAPYLKRLESIDPRAPTLLISSMSLIAAVLVLALPETRDKELPEDIDDDSYDPGPLVRCFVGRRQRRQEITPLIVVNGEAISTTSDA